jgi:diguanylate cyclase (GGDEF)-like protein
MTSDSDDLASPQTGRDLLTPAEIDAQVQRAWALRLQDIQTAIRLSREALEQAIAIGYPSGQAYSLRNLGVCDYRMGQYPRSLEELTAARCLLGELGDRHGEGWVLKNLGNTYQEMACYSDALRCDIESLALLRQTGDLSEEAGLLNNIGTLYVELALYPEALDYLLQAKRLYEQLGNTKWVAYVSTNISSIYIERGEYSLALELFTAALESARVTGEKAEEAEFMIHMGAIQIHLKNYGMALDLCRQGLLLCQQTGNRVVEAMGWIHSGAACWELGQVAVAQEHYRHGLQIAEEIGHHFTQVKALLGLSRILISQARLEEAVRFLELARNLATDLGQKKLLYQAHQQLAMAWEAHKNFYQALEHYKIYFRMQQEVIGLETEMRINGLLVQADLEKVKREAEFYHLKNVELQRAYQELQRADEQKAEMLAQLQQLTRQLEQISREDSLTGLPNRRYLDILLAREFERSLRFGSNFTIAMIDIDNFKQVNDTFSHPVGDQVLKELGRFLLENCRSVDAVGRYGGEEFMLLLVETSLPQAVEACDRLRLEVSHLNWAGICPGLGLTLSIGLAYNQGVSTLEEMVRLADEKLYSAKRSGKNCVRY